MRKRIKDIIDHRFLSHWLVLFADFTIMSGSFIFTYFLRFNLFSQNVNVPTMILQLIFGIPFFLLAVIILKPHRGILRHTTIHDFFLLARAHFLVSFGLFLVSYFGHNFSTLLVIPYSIIIVHYFVSVFIMSAMRYLVHIAYNNLVRKHEEKFNVLIYGAGKLGRIVQDIISKDITINYRIVGFVDDNHGLWGYQIGGVKVISPEQAFSHFANRMNVKEVIMAIPPSKIHIERKREIVDKCLESHLKISEVSDPASWLNEKFSDDKIRSIRIEDLLGREPIYSDAKGVMQYIKGMRVMVTGGAGSIGSEIVRQLVSLKPESIIIVDQAESALYDIQNEIYPLLIETELKVFVADVVDNFKMQKIFQHTRPQIIFHAAAYKHVPLMENQPYEAVLNNVGGTINMAKLAVRFDVEKFVMISTDKAVNPTNIMGATKRISEIYIQSLSKKKGINTQFITTRFGNVLGSNGSVIPLFKKQISHGGPVTLTHKDIIRYFMTIPEACQLVLEAGYMGSGGEIFLFDMGKPIRIYDLAVKMISLSGFIPHKEIEILEVGLRPGEKLYEELLANQEETIPTRHIKILAGKIRPYDYKNAVKLINELIGQLTELSEMDLVAKMKEIAPEFVSNNSRFEVLDIKPEQINVV